MPLASEQELDASPEAVQGALRRVISSAAFSQSPRLSAFLEYVVEARLSGEDDRIQEYGIGLEVFGRGQDFDPRIDSIVRVEARRLRERLSRYYETEGAGDGVRIELPRRGYRPRFVAGGDGGSGRNAAKSGRGPAAPRRPAFRRALPWAVTALALAVAGLAWWSRPGARTGPAVEFAIRAPAGTSHIPVSLGGGAVVSPDGRRVAFVAGVPSGGRALYVRELASENFRHIPGTENVAWPFWGPESRRIGFASRGILKTVDLNDGVVLTLAAAPDFGGGA